MRPRQWWRVWRTSISGQKLRLLLVTHYYPPEIGASPSRLHQLAVYLTERGHDVTVITGFPNYPSGVIPGFYRARRMMRDRVDGVNVLRTWIYPTENSGFAKRLLNHLSFAASSCFASLFAGPADIVVVESPPLFVCAAGPLIRLIKQAKFVINMADLWPEAPVAMGLLTNPTAIAMAEFLANALLHGSDHIVAVPPAIGDYLVDVKGVAKQKVSVRPNSVDVSLYGPEFPVADLSMWISPDWFVVMYAGTLSISHALETAILAAKRLVGQSDIHLVFVGDGPDRTLLQDKANEFQLSNVVFVPPQVRAAMPGVMRRADILLTSGMNYSMVESDFPAKVVEYFATGKPIISCGQARTTIETSGGGIWIPPEDPVALAEAIMKLYNSPNDRDRMGRAGRAYAESHLNRADILRSYEETLLEVANHNQAGSAACRSSHGAAQVIRNSFKPSLHRRPLRVRTTKNVS